MSAKGWIKLHRKTLDSEVFRDPDLFRLWSLLLMKASHSQRLITWDGEEVRLKAGQFITGRKSLHDEYNEGLSAKHKTKDTTLWNRLKTLEKMGNLHIETAKSRKYSIVTLTQWDDYQEESDVHTTENTTEEKPKNDKEESEEMKDFIEAGKDNDKDLAPVDNGKKKKGKRVYEKGDIEYNLASYLFYWMLQNNPEVKKPNPQKWADTIRLMIERDNRDPDDIKKVIYFCQHDDFWRFNILSPDKLRKQYDQLKGKMISEAQKKAKRSGVGYKSRGSQKNDALREMMEEELNNGSSGDDQTLYLDK